MDSTYTTQRPWDSTRPHTLVIVCSDGRVQENVDEFLASQGVRRYDRLYLPGGPGALASSGGNFLRADVARKECEFLIHSHEIEAVFLIFHGPAPDGPPEAVCADYRRKMPTQTPEEIAMEQIRDANEILRNGFGWHLNPMVRAFRCEITGAGAVQFVEIPTQKEVVTRFVPTAGAAP